MIRVMPQDEPAEFDNKVRQRGLAYLTRQKINLNEELPSGTELPPYWRDCLDDLYRLYQGVCAYLCVRFERTIGAATADHYIAKKTLPRHAYEWSNYRLACMAMNSRKRDFEDVLDPFLIKEETFRLDLISGSIYPNPSLSQGEIERAQNTIDRLGLDDVKNREMRARHYQEYKEWPLPVKWLKVYSPFVWYEAQRQGLL